MMLRSGLWAFAGAGGQAVVNLALVVILARLLTPEAFGIVAAAQVVLVLTQVLAKFGLGAALIQADSLSRSMERTALTLMMGFALVMAAAIHLATPLLAQLMNIPELVEVMPVMLVTLLLSAATNPGMNLLMREMRFKLLAAIDASTIALLHGVIAVTLALAGWSYWAIILATLASTAAKALVVWWIRPVWPTLSMRRDEVRALLRFGSGVFLVNLMVQVANKADNVVVASSFGATALGIYSRAFTVLDLTNALLSNVFRTVLFSGFSSNRRKLGSSREEMAQTFLQAHAFAAFLILPACAVSVVLAPEIVYFLLGQQWAEVVPILQVLALGMYFQLGYKVSQSLNLAEGRVFSTAWRLLVYAVLVAVFAGIGAQFGPLGVGYGVLLALAAVFGLLTKLSLVLLKLQARRLIVAVIPFAALGGFSAGGGWIIADILRNSVGLGSIVLSGTAVSMAVLYLAPLWFMRRLPIIRNLLREVRNLQHQEIAETRKETK